MEFNLLLIDVYKRQVETYAVATTSDELCVNAVTTETVDSNLTNRVLRELRYEVSIMTIVSQADSYVRDVYKRQS